MAAGQWVAEIGAARCGKARRIVGGFAQGAGRAMQVRRWRVDGHLHLFRAHMGTSRVLLLASLLVATGCQHVQQKPAAVASQGLRSTADDYVFRVEPAEISPGQEAELEWRIQGATKVVIDEAVYGDKLHRLGTFDAVGSVKVKPLESSTYVISCGESSDLACASVTLKVRIKN